MGRLIDAEKLNAEFEDIINFLENDTKARETLSKEDACECIKALRECVDDQPTAYDVEKVVAELELEKETAYRTYETFNHQVDLGRVFGMEKAIEIVRKGEVE